MKQITLPAYAKLNLTLDILRKRPDGYHDLRMVMQSIALHDQVTIVETDDGDLACHTNLPYLSSGEGNLAVKAARHFFRHTGLPVPGLNITIEKRIPVSAGMAGGSTDAAAVLRGLRTLYAPTLSDAALEEIGLLAGSDVPFCLRGGTALAEGQGERLTDLPGLPPCYLVLCKPPFPISTPELFGCVQLKKLRLHPDTTGVCAALERQDLDGLCRRLYNVFEDVLPNRYREVLAIKRRMTELGALASLMTGSGPTVYGVFARQETARRAWESLSTDYTQTFFTVPVGKMV